MITRLKHLLWVCAMAFLFASIFGCGSRKYDFSFEIANNRSVGECALLIKSNGGFNIQFSRIVAKTWATYNGPFEYHPNDIYTISWVDENGHEYIAEVDLRNILSKRHTGYLIFRINDENNLISSASLSYKGDEMFSITTKGKKIIK